MPALPEGHAGGRFLLIRVFEFLSVCSASILFAGVTPQPSGVTPQPSGVAGFLLVFRLGHSRAGGNVLWGTRGLQEVGLG